jgi:uncharacterized protein YfbU (UPF0304 family)
MSEKVTLSPGEKLILLMLSDLHDHLKIKSETDTKLLREAIFSGNLWGLEWAMSGVFHGHETPTVVVDETANILTMWDRLEQSYESLSQADKDWLSNQVSLSSSGAVFPGFDGNNESEYLNAADFLINHLGRFSRFKDRKELNAHMPTLEGYRRMYAVFDPILQDVLNQNFTAAQIAQVLVARRASKA